MAADETGRGESGRGEWVDLDAVAGSARRRQAGVQAAGSGGGAPRPSVTSAMFARQMEERAQSEMLRRMSDTCGSIDPRELDALIQRVADLKSRYYAAILDAGASRGIPQPDQFKELSTLRSWAEELERGLEHLRQGISRGEIRVQGVDERF